MRQPTVSSRDHQGPSGVRAGRAGRPPWLPALLVALLLPLLLPPSAAVARTIPAESQLPIYFKLLTYDRTLWEAPAPRLRIGLLHRLGDEASRKNLVAMVEALDASSSKTINGASFEFTTIAWKEPADLARQIAQAGIDVLYVTAGHGDVLPAIAASTREEGILSLAGDVSDVGRGLSVGLDPAGDSIRIEVDLEALAAEGHQLDARVLRLCRVVNR